MTATGHPAQNPRRSSRQRRAVVDTMSSLDDFRSTQEIHSIMRTKGYSIGLTTVYRTLQSLATAGDIDVLRRDDGEAMYRRCSEEHHHHLVCRACGQTIEVMGSPLEHWITAVATEHGFTAVSHTLELHGLCEKCSLKDSA